MAARLPSVRAFEIRLVAATCCVALAMFGANLGQSAHAQGQVQGQGQGQTGSDWGAATQVAPTQRPQGSPAGRPAAPSGGWKEQNNITIVPRSTPEPKSKTPIGEVTLTAVLSEDGAPIEDGIVWRAFQADPGSFAAKPRLVGSWREANPTLKLPPGEYLLNAAFGRAHLTRKVTISAGTAAKEQFVLNAGGLRISAVLNGGEAVPPSALSYDVYVGESEVAAAHTKIISGARPGLIVRLNAGVYQIVSTYGDTNSIVRADVTVDAGKLSEATITHLAAKVTFKLVTRPGGEAIADTQWTVQSPQGELIRESQGALPSHVLAAGPYVVIARNGGNTFKRAFTLEAGNATQVEVVMQ